MFKSIIRTVISSFSNLKKIEIEDLICIFYLLIAYFPAVVLRIRKRNLWCIVERIDSADDNGWHFYQWMKKNHPEQPVYFLLGKQARQFDPKDETMVAWKSFKHYVIYLASDIHIKTIFMTARPNPRVCSYYERLFKRNLKIVYLRHGISKDGLEHHKYSVQRVRLFICGAKPEFDYVNENAEYPAGYVVYTGFARFDSLYNHSGMSHTQQILIMPTWRRYLHDSEKSVEENEKLFVGSVFYRYYNSLLHNNQLKLFLQRNHIKAVFCIHPEFNRYRHLLQFEDDSIKIVNNTDVSIHELLLNTSLLITDYSSVFFDVAYMQKPTVYYHFDYDEFRAKHFSEGYFSYERDGMGPIVKTETDLIQTIDSLFDGTSFVCRDEYKSRIGRFFPLRDNNNCERIYQEILKV